jgi:NADH-quinone oxidoreductase subunit H
MLDWIQNNIPPWVYITIIVHLVVLGTVAYLILLERKVASWVQDRIGPNRTGLGFGIIPILKDMKMFGLGQPLADGLKFIVKEDYQPGNVDRILFTLAPVIMVIVIIISIAVVPWGGIKGSTTTLDLAPALAAGQTPMQAVEAALPPHHRVIGDITVSVVTDPNDPDYGRRSFVLSPERPNTTEALVIPPGATATASYTHGWYFQIANLNIGVLFVLAVLSLSVYGVVLGGFASNSKYSFLGGLRATASMVSYEIPLGLSVLVVVIMFGTLDLAQIVHNQTHYWAGFIPAWNVFVQPIAFLLFLICIHAEANRAPFDLAEAEQELVGGFHTEYSSMRFALFFLGEYAGMITTACVCVALFFGGWHVPGLDALVARMVGGTIDATRPWITDSLTVCIVRALVFFTKAILVLFVFMWVRWSLPRFRFDQLMGITWRGLLPIALALVMATALVVYFTDAQGYSSPMTGTTALWYLGMNVVLFAIAAGVSVLLPATDVNRKMPVRESRFRNTPLPAWAKN